MPNTRSRALLLDTKTKKPVSEFSGKSLFENEFLFALDKPMGVPSSLGKNVPFENTAISLALAQCPELEKNLKWSEEFGLLHRLDNETSGILLFAKTQDAFNFYRGHWGSGSVEKSSTGLVNSSSSVQKIYQARTHVPSSPLPSEITFQIGHSAKSAKRMICINDPKKLNHIRGKPLDAQTLILNVKPVSSTQLDDPEKLLEITVQITTGVHHQIRCHLAALGAPILGDVVYEPKELREETKRERMYLHSSRLVLPAFEGKESIYIESRAPWLV